MPIYLGQVMQSIRKFIASQGYRHLLTMRLELGQTSATRPASSTAGQSCPHHCNAIGIMRQHLDEAFDRIRLGKIELHDSNKSPLRPTVESQSLEIQAVASFAYSRRATTQFNHNAILKSKVGFRLRLERLARGTRLLQGEPKVHQSANIRGRKALAKSSAVTYQDTSPSHPRQSAMFRLGG